MKSFLQLLREEDKACKEYEARKQGYKNLSKSSASQDMLLEFRKIVDEEWERLCEARENISKYILQAHGESTDLDPETRKPAQIEPFMWMLSSMAESGILEEECERSNISKSEMFACIGYLANMLGMFYVW